MKTKCRRLPSLLLVFVLVMGLMPSVHASNGDGTEASTEPTKIDSYQQINPAAMDTVDPDDSSAETESDTGMPKPETEGTEPEETEDPTEAASESEEASSEGDDKINTGILEYSGYSTTLPNRLLRAASSSSTLRWYGMYQIQTRSRSINYFTYTAANGVELSANLRAITRMYMDGTVAYCIRPGWTASDGASYTEDDQISAWRTYLNDAQREAIATVVALGYPMQSFTDGTDTGIYTAYGDSKSEWQTSERYAATQILIWEFLMGWRSPDYPYTLDTSKTSSSGRTLLATFYSASDNNANWPTLIKVYNEILQAMKNSKRIPSFASETASGASAIKLVKNASTGKYEATLTDTNGVLSDYTFKSSASGITFTKSGNTLTISATAEAASAMGTNGVLASTTGSAITVDPDEAVIIWYAPSGSQSVITPVNAGISSTVAYIKLTADASGSATMKKTTTAADGDVDGYCFKIYQWGGSSWYGKTDANGDVYVTDENYSASTKTYTFTGLSDGHYTFLEVLSKKGAGNVFPDSWRIIVKNSSGITVYDKIFTSEISRDANGDARLGTNDAKISITGLSGGGTMTMTINNAPDTGDLEIVKTNSSGNVSGFQFLVTGNGISQTVTSGSNGRIRVEGLTEGTYTVKELLSIDSAYYCTSTNPQTVTVESGKVASVTFNNELKKWRITVTKEDTETGSAQADATLDGAVYGLYKNGTLVKQYTVKNGVFNTDSYVCGIGYTLKEISAPPGYQLDTDVYNLDAYSAAVKCSGPLTTSQVTVLEDIIEGYFQITKRTKNPVSGATAAEVGAVFRYYLKSEGSFNACPNNLKGTMTTGSNGIGKSKALPYGTYMVEQTGGTTGTDFIDSFDVTISEQGKTYSYTKDNPWWTGTVSIVKYEEGTTTPLIVKFNLLDAEQNVLETGTTDANGKLSFKTKMVYGVTCYVQEAEVPEGYVLDATMHPITVTQRDQKISLTLENRPEEGSITVRKIDIQGSAMPGVKFLLEYSTDGTSWKPVTYREKGGLVCVGGCTSQGLKDGTLTTGSDGVVTFTGLRINTQISKVYYRLTELSTEDGSTMLIEHAYKGQLPLDGSKDIIVTAVNSDVYELPHTGSSSMLWLQFIQILCMVCFAGLICIHRKREH